MPSPPYHEDVSPEYTFVAHVTTTAILNNPQADMPVNTPNRHIMTIEFKCRTHELEALLCHIGKHKQYPTKMRSLVNISDNYQKTKFQIRFNKDGVVDYAVERTYDDTMDFLLNLFRFFGSQLNVGVELNPYKDVYADSSTFKSTEQSVIGSCLTHFDINHLRTKDETLDKSTYLSLDEYYYFEYKDALRISKQRYAQDCHTTSSYMFSSSFWSEFLPDNVGEDIVSISLSCRINAELTCPRLEIFCRACFSFGGVC